MMNSIKDTTSRSSGNGGRRTYQEGGSDRWEGRIARDHGPEKPSGESTFNEIIEAIGEKRKE